MKPTARALAGATFLAIVLAATAIWAQPFASAGSADNVQDVDLARMTLPLSVYGTEYSEFVVSPFTGFTDPQALEQGEINDYSLFFDPHDVPLTPPFIGSVGSTVGAFSTTSDATTFLNDIRQTVQGDPDTFTQFAIDSVPAQ